MHLKANWKDYLHNIKRKDTDLIFGYLGNRNFNFGLEIGAGDGYQTGLLAPHFRSFVSSDLNFSRIKEEYKNPDVRYVQCDADSMGGKFEAGQFDLVFSSSVLEHLSRLEDFLRENVRILSPGGYAVHIVPNRWMKFFYVIFFYPNIFILTLDRLSGALKGKKIFQGESICAENNINKVYDRKEGKLKKILVPKPHGNYGGHFEEWKAWGRRRWEREFTEAGFCIEKEIKGSTLSGYGFGLDFLRTILEGAGVVSETIFILRKQT